MPVRAATLFVFAILSLSQALAQTETAPGEISEPVPVTQSEDIHPIAMDHLQTFLRLLRGEDIELQESDFTLQMRSRRPVGELQSAFQQLGASNGGYANLGIIDHGPGVVTTVIKAQQSEARARLSIMFEPDGERRIDGVLIHPDLPSYDSWAQFTEALENSGADASVSIAELLPDGSAETLFSYKEDRSLAIAYHARLFVLDALVEKIAAGEADWLDVVLVRDDLKSLAPGATLDAEEGSALTIAELAQRMMIDGDHSANDHLFAELGRERIERAMVKRVARTARNIPFLSTREAFNIRLILTEKYIEHWANRDNAGQRELLKEIDTIVVAEAVYKTWSRPVAVPVVGWFATAKELNELFVALYLDGRTPRQVTLGGIINELPPAFVDSTIWTSSKSLASIEPGIIAGTWLLAHRDGRIFVMSAVFNSPENPISAPVVGALLVAAAETLSRTAQRFEADEPDAAAP